jgi:hypothetical protein
MPEKQRTDTAAAHLWQHRDAKLRGAAVRLKSQVDHGHQLQPPAGIEVAS